MISSTKVLVVASLVLFPAGLNAQGPGSPPETPSEQLLKVQAIEALVAPIALYPDTLLAQVLMASTYPLEIVRAERWAKDNKKLQGDRLKAELNKQPWDESVKSLVNTPSVLSMMSGKLEWTQELGDAVLAQQPDVMDAIQRLRSMAYGNEKLKTTKEQKVTVKEEGTKQFVTIEPAEAGIVHVPYYDPGVVYGDWPYPEYPPYYMDQAYFPGTIIGTGIAFGAAYTLWRWADGRFWGGGINWGGGRVDINRGAHVEHWRHNPQHRRGVGYKNPHVRQHFTGSANRPGSNRNMDYRGRGGQKLLKPGENRPNVGEKRPANRANADGKGRSKQAGQAQRPSQASRPTHKRSAKAGSSRNVASRHSATRVARGPRQGFGYSAPRGGHRAVNRSFGGRSFGSRGGGGFRGGGGRGGRRSDIALKRNVVLLGHLANGLGFYRFEYKGSQRVYVGVMAQEVQSVKPEAVVQGRDGYLRVQYEKLGLRFQTYREWIGSGARLPAQPWPDAATAIDAFR
jgi:hypothetical protein